MAISPAPKPEPRTPRIAKRIARCSQKKLARLNGKLPYSTAKRSEKGVAKKKRTPSEFRRIYGSRERVKWVKTLDCLAEGPYCDGPIHGHHVITGGTGRKADAKFIVPLCEGHHRELHSEGRHTFEADYRVNLIASAADVSAAWIQLCEFRRGGEGRA